jgi:GNAT superfamily N-acetyltransferase
VVEIAEVPVEETFGLRERVLRHDRRDLPLRMPEDEIPGVFHLAALDAARQVVAVATFAPSAPRFPLPRPCYRLRQMAVHPDRQGQGIGSALLVSSFDRLRARGAAAMWAEARDSSVVFYEAHGMRVAPGRQHRIGSVAYTDMFLVLDAPPAPQDRRTI